MYNRRKFIKVSAATASITALSRSTFAKTISSMEPAAFPIVISTWNFGVDANKEAWKTLEKGGRSLDAVEAGVKIPEAEQPYRRPCRLP
jgi:N4-(beta-N-acetylglucosaminyl)-L-asparaginase